MFSNGHVTLSHYKDSLRGKIKDYIILFEDVQTCPKQVANITFTVVRDLLDNLQAKGTIISARLIALVEYIHVESETVRSYFHPSYSSEVIDQADDFFFTHMLKIAERMDTMNRNGSNLKIKGIKEIHIHITECN